VAQLYECMFIARPTLDDEELAGVIEQVKQAVTTGGGEVVNLEMLGKRRLAYEIEGNTDGIYGLMYFHGSQDVIQELKRELQLSTDVIRSMVVKANERAMSLRATVAAGAERETQPEHAATAPEQPEEPQTEPAAETQPAQNEDDDVAPEAVDEPESEEAV